MKVTYFINQYPKVSHTFIRREIMALERLGLEIQRVSLRGWDEKPIDEDDIAEQKKTRYVLKNGIYGLIVAFVKVLIKQPLKTLSALKLAINLGLGADKSLVFHLIYFLEACQTYLWVNTFGGKHLHAHFGTNPSEVAMLVNALGGPPFSFTVHGPEEFDRPRFLKLKEKIEYAQFVVAISSFGRSQLMRWVDYSQWSKIHEVHCGLESAFYTVPATPFPKAPRFVCVGRLCEQKGQLLLIEAAHRLKQNGMDFQLVLAGDGELRDPIENLIKQYRLEENIRITGWISSDAVRSELLESRALVLPSFAEGLPVVIMEAMSLRRPVLTTYIAGIPELVSHQTHGWLIPAGSVQLLYEAMEEMLRTSIADLELMGEAAYWRVIERHNIDIEAEKLAKLFKQTGSYGSK